MTWYGYNKKQKTKKNFIQKVKMASNKVTLKIQSSNNLFKKKYVSHSAPLVWNKSKNSEMLF